MTEPTKPKRIVEKWSDMEIFQLRELYGTMTAAEVGKQIGRTKSSVLKKAKILKIRNYRDNKSEKWPNSLIEKLKTLGPTMTAKAFMKEYGLTKDSVYNHARKFKIKFKSDVFWTPERIEVIRQFKSASEAAETLGIGKDAVLRRAKRSGIILKETRIPSIVKQAPVRFRTAQKRVPAVKARYKRSGSAERSRIEYCPTCHSPVSNWQEHFDRMGHRRPAA
jgi:hypothetical protein